jgi:hypothetical protein
MKNMRKYIEQCFEKPIDEITLPLDLFHPCNFQNEETYYLGQCTRESFETIAKFRERVFMSFYVLTHYLKAEDVTKVEEQISCHFQFSDSTTRVKFYGKIEGLEFPVTING